MVSNAPPKHALVIGAGPAGLMAAEVMARRGVTVTVAEQKPSPARKFLMAGKSGLNLTKEDANFNAAYAEATWLYPMLDAFGAAEVQTWAEGLGQTLFTGSTGRVFPTAMKASPLLRAWLARLDSMGVVLNTRWKWTGWEGDTVTFETPDGVVSLTPDVTVLACGGASWSRLGSDGAWSAWMDAAPFQPANVGLEIDWSDHMISHFGTALKSVRWMAVRGRGKGRSIVASSRGEAIVSRRGLEGGGIYPLIPALRAGARLTVDLFPDVPLEKLMQRVPETSKRGLSKILKSSLRLPPEKLAFAMENTKGRSHFVVVPLSKQGIAGFVKSMPVHFDSLRPIDEAISTAGGLRAVDLTDGLMLKQREGTFACGEMLDWEAPTGGYLLTACFATGAWAGQNAADYLFA